MITRRAFQAGLLAAGWSLDDARAEIPAAGSWSALRATGSLPLRLKLEIGTDGAAKLFSHGSAPIVGRVSVTGGDEVRLEFPRVGAVFDGHMASPTRIEGTWRQGGSDFPLVFHRDEAALAPPPALPLTRERLAMLRANAGSPAMAAASARGHSASQIWVDGERVVGSGIAVEPTDQWHLGSITKSMTASLIGCLVDQGALHWDDTVGQLLGAVAPDMREVYRAVTFRHLLCHRSGLPRDLPMLDLLPFSSEIADTREDRKAYARKALVLAPVGSMGATFTYANNGYVVAGAMVEAKLGKSWEDLITANLFMPLGLASAGFGAPGHAGASDEPVGHAKTMVGELRKPFPIGAGVSDNPAVIGPAGRVHMSLPDLLRYLGAHRDRTDYLRAETWTTLHTPPFGGDYAMGWAVRHDRTLWHNGSNMLWYAEVLVDANHGVVAAAAANDGYLDKSGPAVGAALFDAAAAA